MVPVIMRERVGIERLAMATGAATMGTYTGGALGPWLGGLIFDISGSYLWALLLAAGASIAGLIIVLRILPAKWEIFK